MTDGTREIISVSKTEFVSIDKVNHDPKGWAPNSLIYKVCDDKTMVCVGTLDNNKNFVAKTPPTWFLNETLRSKSDILSELITHLIKEIQGGNTLSNKDYKSLWERYQKEILEGKSVILKGPKDGKVSY